MSAEPLSVTGGTGPIVPIALVNQQAQAKSQPTQSTADTSGVKPQDVALRNKVDDPNVPELNKRAEKNEAEAKNPLGDKPLKLDEAIETFKQYLDKLPSDLKFHVDKEASRTVFKVVNPVTREVVKQYPTDEFLHMVKKLRESTPGPKNNGLLVDDKF
ncbi:MAG: flagellar protein FlaG [Holophagaceae bacterium]|nr:flagellar protein FlaG [Holophagaceae bacterium]